MDEKCKVYYLEEIKEEQGCKFCHYHHKESECRYPFYQQVVIPAILRHDVNCPAFKKREGKQMSEIKKIRGDKK